MTLSFPVRSVDGNEGFCMRDEVEDDETPAEAEDDDEKSNGAESQPGLLERVADVVGDLFDDDKGNSPAEGRVHRD